MRTDEHNAKNPSAKAGLFATLTNPLHARGSSAPATRHLALCGALAMLLICFASPSLAQAKQARLLAGTFGAASNPAPFPANPYPLSEVVGLAVDSSAHDVYVSDPRNHRVEKFDFAGNFILMLGREVNKTAVEEARPEAEQNLCPAPGHPADLCQEGKEGSTPAAFESPQYLAVDNSTGESKGDLYVADTGTQVNEQQTVSVNATGGTFTLTFKGQTTAPIPFDATGQEFRKALEALSTVGFANLEDIGSPPNHVVEFRAGLAGRDLPQLTCDASVLTGAGHSCAVATAVQGSSTARVAKFDSGGQIVTSWAEAGQLDGSAIASPPAPLEGPFVTLGGLAVDSSGNLWVAARPGNFEFRPDAGFIAAWKPGFEQGIAVDSEDNLYRNFGGFVEKFDSTGKELGVVAPSKAEIESSRSFRDNGLASDASANDLYLNGDEGGAGIPTVGVLKRYDSSCHPVKTLEVPQPGCEAVESFGAGQISPFSAGLAIDSSSKALYVGDDEHVAVFSFLTVPDVTTTKPLNPTPTSATLTGTVDPGGVELHEGLEGCRFEWGETTAYGHTEPCDKTAAQIGSGIAPVEVKANITGLEAGHTYHYRLVAANHNDVNEFINEPSLGQDLAFGPPLIESASALDVTATGAVLQAQVSPNDLDTRLRIEYVTQQQFEALGFSEPLSTEVVDLGDAGSVQTAVLHLSGLAPNTTYHYRVVAESALAEGPEAVIGPELTFTTQGASASALPDARRWELVSPPNKLGASLYPSGRGSLIQASASGDAITYAANAPTEPLPPGNYESRVQVLSARGPAAWASRDINRPRAEPTGAGGNGSEIEFFSSDLSQAILQPDGPLNPPLSPEAPEHTPYIRTNFSPSAPTSFCLNSCYQPLITEANVPPGTNLDLSGAGFSVATPDLRHIVLGSSDPLTSDPAPEGGLYEWSAGQLQLISIRPGAGGPTPAGAGPIPGDRENERNAISTDGNRVVWFENQGKHHLYLRDLAREETVQLDAVHGGSGKGTVAPHFQTASIDGSLVYFVDGQQLTSNSAATIEEPDLYQCEIVEAEGGQLECKLTDLSPENSGESGGVLGTPGASADGSYVYFVANGVLTGSEENANHETAQPGHCGENQAGPAATCNLYLHHDGTTSFIGLLSAKDTGDWAKDTERNTKLLDLTARVSSNGRWLAFMSQHSLTGYDNRDAVASKADEEVFLFHAGVEGEVGNLICASCNSTGARPHGVEFSHLEPGHGSLAGGNLHWRDQWIAANLPSWDGTVFDAVHQPRYLSDSGRLFFNSSDALVPRDTNGTGDVYQYEPPGVGDCSEESSAFVKSSGGCLSLISSGTSKDESAFLDASESGDDVFFLSSAQLSKRDIDTALDVYDARVNGGEAEPIPPVLCEGDGCQQPATPPNDPTPGSLTFNGAGNLAECPKGKVKKSGKCVAKHHKKKHPKKNKKKAHKRANTNRRAGK